MTFFKEKVIQLELLITINAPNTDCYLLKNVFTAAHTSYNYIIIVYENVL